MEITNKTFGIFTIKDDVSGEYHVYTKQDKTGAVNPLGSQANLVEAVENAKAANFNNKADIRRFMYETYYKTEVEGMNNFNFSDIVNFLVALTDL
jgi:SHS2 domain-containing protein